MCVLTATSVPKPASDPLGEVLREAEKKASDVKRQLEASQRAAADIKERLDVTQSILNDSEASDRKGSVKQVVEAQELRRKIGLLKIDVSKADATVAQWVDELKTSRETLRAAQDQKRGRKSVAV